MPDRMISASAGAMEALHREITCARLLLQALCELEEAVHQAAPAETIWKLVRAQEAAALAASQAARSRAQYFPAEGSVEVYLQGRAPSEVSAFRALLAEAAPLRGEIERMARRTEYLARRSVEWTQAQLDVMVQWVTRPAATYERPGSARPLFQQPAFMDRSA